MLKKQFKRRHVKKCEKVLEGKGASLVIIVTIEGNKKTNPCIDCKNKLCRGFYMKDYIEERAVEIAYYIIEHKATVRQTAKAFGVSKSTIHMVVIK